MNRQTSPLFLRVSIGLGLATAAITSTLRADPSLFSDLQDGGASHSSPAAVPRALAHPDNRADFAFAPNPRPASPFPASSIASPSREASHPPMPSQRTAVTPAAPIHEATPIHEAARLRETARIHTARIHEAALRQTPVQPPVVRQATAAHETAPIYAATVESLTTQPTTIQPTTSTQFQHPDDHLMSSPSTQAQVKPAVTGGGAHLDGWRVAGHGSTFDAGHGTHPAPRHRQG